MKKANTEERKVAYIGKHTYNRIIKRLNLSELRILEELENKNNKKVYKVISLNSSLNTKLERYIYNNEYGEFFISDGINDTNKIKLTKILKGLWNIDNPQELDKLNKKWKSYYINVDNIKISDCLSEIYNMKHYGEDSNSNSSISNSCMIGKGEYYKWLDKEQNVKIAYLTDKEGVLIGRAILWYGVELWIEEENFKINFMDRIYSKNDYIEELFKKWAREHGFYYKKNQSYCNKKSIISPSGEEFNNAYMKFELERGLDGNEKCPYMDTFTFLDEDLTILNNDDGYYELDYTDGGGIINNYYCDYCHEERIDIEEAIYIEGYGYICEHCLERDFVYCEDTQDYRHIDDCYYCETDGNWYYYDDDLIEIRGNYYRKDDNDMYFCEECEEWEHEKYYSSYTAIKYDDEITICSYCANSSYYIHIDNIKGDNPYNDYIEYVYYKNLYEDKEGNYWFSEEDYLESLKEEEDNNDDN